MRKGFTLVELMVAVTILGIMTVALFEVYSSVSLANRRLDRTRVLTDATRTVTERIARDVRDLGIDFSQYSLLASEPLDYAGHGNTWLFLSGGVRYFSAQEGATLQPCVGSGGCFVVREENGQVEKLTGPDIDIHALRFYISGDPKNTAAPGKVTVVGSFDLVPRLKESPLAPGMDFQTTVAERPYNRQ